LYQIIRKEHNYKQTIISHHLDYLIQKGWIIGETERKNFTKNGISREKIKHKFKISDLGIEKYEDGSAFRHIRNNSAINITSTNSVIFAGNGNIVNANYSDLSQKLEDFRAHISENTQLTEEQKLNSQADIATIQNQLSKPKPNNEIIKSAWASIQFIVTIPGLITFYNQLHNYSTTFLNSLFKHKPFLTNLI
jgi:hypothetical protein